jgi:protein SCO1
MNAIAFALALLAADDVGVDEKLGSVVPADISLRDEDGRPVTFGSLVDRPTILTLNYFRCAGICTPLLNNLQRTLDQIALEPGKDFRTITVSFDPRDTAAIAKEKRANYLRVMGRPFPPDAWRFLTGTADATKRLSDAVGFKFRAEGEEFVHPGLIVLLSPGRKVVHYGYGTTFLPVDLQTAIEAAARGTILPSVATSATPFPMGARGSPLGLICFSYDPQGRRYVDWMKLGGLATVAGASAFGAWLLIRGGRPQEKKESRP